MTTADMSVDEPRRLTRSREGRIVAGVCDGAARYFDIDPVIFRVVLAVLAIFGGTGIVIYALAWLLIPEDGSPATRLERWLEGKHGDRRRDILIVAGALFVVIFLANNNPFAHRIGGAFFGVVIILSAAALVGRRRHPRTRTAAAPTAPFGPAPSPDAATANATAEQPTAVWTPLAKPARPRSWLGWLTLGATLLVAGVVSSIGVSGAAHPQPADVLAACVAVIGVGLLVGAVFGRAWLMIPVGLLLVGALAVANALPRNLTWTAGQRTWTPVTATAQSPYVLGTGDATIDLSQLAPHQAASVVSRVGAGRLIVIVPVGSALAIHTHASAGRIVIFGQEQDGAGVTVDQHVAGTSPRARSVTLNLDMGFGDVEVRNAAA